jgi:hypothetical protein
VLKFPSKLYFFKKMQNHYHLAALAEAENIPALLEELVEYIKVAPIYYRGNKINPKNSTYFRGVDQFLKANNIYTKELAKHMSDFPHKNLDEIETLCPKFSTLFKKAIKLKREKMEKKTEKVEKRILDFLENESIQVIPEQPEVQSELSREENLLRIAVQNNAKTFRMGDCEITF